MGSQQACSVMPAAATSTQPCLDRLPLLSTRGFMFQLAMTATWVNDVYGLEIWEPHFFFRF